MATPRFIISSPTGRRFGVSAPRSPRARSARIGRRAIPPPLPKDPLWYKDAIIYEVHVRAFFDSDADGIGDFGGLTERLDYLSDLGITAIWLLPFYPSPLKDDGYDIADYYSINPIYGTLKDFKTFLAAAHQRNLRVITELVVNHTSDQHPWFQRSRRAPRGSLWRKFYVWSDTPEKYREARIIFRDFEPSNWTWDPVAHAYFWHRFYSHQPDLNFDNPQVHQELTRVLDFWLDLGVDGLRLDAVPYLYEREGTSCENLEETHQFLKVLRQHVDERYGDRMLLAEANQWPEDAVSYFGSGAGDETHMAFHFPLMPRLFMAVRMEDRVPIVDILEQTPPIPQTSQWALFLRNHDELTLEMVTDEERDYMYRVYADDAKARINLGIRRRLAPLLGNDRKRIELLHLLLFSLPGTPVLYYGDEIAMGDNVFLGDRNGVRTPMQWSSDKNAGFSRASPQALYLPIILDPEYHYEAVNVENQQRNPNSLFWWMKRTLTLRKRFKAFGRGSLSFLQPENRKVLAFVRSYESENLLVIANLSRFPQPVQLDLSEYQHSIPVELFGHADFPPVTDKPYFLTFSPHAAYWFLLEPLSSRQAPAQSSALNSLLVTPPLEDLFEGEGPHRLESHLAEFLKNKRWFGGKGRQIKSVQIGDSLGIPVGSGRAFILLLTIEYVEGDPEEYVLPAQLAGPAEAAQVQEHLPDDIIARLRFDDGSGEGVLYAAASSPDFCKALLEAIARRRSFASANGELKATPTPDLRQEAANGLVTLEPSFRKAEQSNSSVVFGNKFFLKLFRRLESGVNPDLEIGRFLTERNFPNLPPVSGWLEYRRQTGEEFTLGILTRFLAQAQDAWSYTLDMLSRYFERIRTGPVETGIQLELENSVVGLAERPVPESVVGLIGTYLELGRLLGERTGQLHLALSSETQDRNFAPEPFTPFYQRALFQSMRNFVVQSLRLLRRGLPRLAESVRGEAEKVLCLEPEILRRLRAIVQSPIASKRIRCHGDFHLGQVLYTGKDFMFIDFEGEPARALGERRIKRSPLRDVAGMIRSFHYVTYAALFKQLQLGALQEQELPSIEPWNSFWYRWVSAVYLKAYLAVLQGAELLPESKDQLTILLEAHLLEKAVYEVGYELSHRPDWVKIPLRGILQLLEPVRPG
ncbi:MAG TPA: maltose alpha-D-glucosyltransferase [Verrucomicrobiae bacterium]|nr:maltose alpha-D-glucosyltransferase [Verrucomicrobiae bacterium]